jgi:3-phosphoshikimate 1-carboxyvinyltransferase
VKLRVPGDKSITQRALILAALADGESILSGLSAGGDPASTAAALRVLGVPLGPLPGDGSPLRVRGVGLSGLAAPLRAIDLGNSGTGARLLMGALAGTDLAAVVTGDESLRSRPMARVVDPLTAMGAEVRFLEAEGRLPLQVDGRHPLAPLHWTSPVASAQVKSALLLAGVTGSASVVVDEPTRSRDHTERILSMAGVSLVEQASGGGWRVELRDPPDRLEPLEFRVPGDPSSAAFLAALAALGGAGDGVEVTGVGLNPTRTAFLEAMRRMGARVEAELDPPGMAGGEPSGTLSARPGALAAVVLEPSDVPGLIDELPLLAAMAARAEGETRITGAGELRLKESDRIRVMVANLRAVGADAEELADGMVVRGSDRPLSGRVHTHGDHRIAMAFGVLGALPGNRITVDDPDAADVSFPGFWDILRTATGTGR